MENIDLFEQMAKRYDNQERIAVAKIISSEIRKNIADAKEKSTIDYGCGTGLVGLNIADMFKSILFVDASLQMVEQVKYKIEKAHIQNASTLCDDFTLNVPSSLKADYMILSQVLLHIKDTQLILSNLYKLLNDGGHLLIIDFDKEESIVSDKVHNGFEQAYLIELLKDIGFASAKADTFYHGEKIFMNQDASLFLLDAQK